MPEFTLNRNYTLRSTKGHIINFKKDVPVSVPGKLVADAVAIGAVAVDPQTPLPAGETDYVAPVVLTGADREAKIRAAFDAVLARNQRNDFTASGHPHVRAVSQLLGFDVDAKERDKLWQEFIEAREDTKANT
jgi:hypothetical protein